MDSADPDVQVVDLDPTLDLNAAGELARQLIELRGKPVRIDASRVQRMGAQCVQVLLSAEKTWATDGVAFAVAEPSEDFTSTLGTLGASFDAGGQFQELSA